MISSAGRPAPWITCFIAPVHALHGILLATLTSATDAGGDRLIGAGFDRFPRVGCVRLEDVGSDQAELRIYTLNEGGALAMPKHSGGGGIFVGRYGTTTRAFDSGTPVFWQPVRAWDRYTEFSNDPELSFWSFSTQMREAFLKRISWSERIPERTNLRVMLRLNEGAPWDADSRRVVYLSEDGSPKPRQNRGDPSRQGIKILRGMDVPNGANIIGVQADRAEIRVFVTYMPGAYDWARPGAIGWKSTPRLEALHLEYVQPSRVWRHVDLR